MTYAVPALRYGTYCIDVVDISLVTTLFVLFH